MTVAVGNWLDTVDFSTDFPNEPLVPVAIHQEDPFQFLTANREALDQIGSRSPKSVREKISARNEAEKLVNQCRVFHGEHASGVSFLELRAIGRILLESGPEAAESAWRSLFPHVGAAGQEREVTLRCEERYTVRESAFPGHRWASAHEYHVEKSGWTVLSRVPNFTGITPVAAALYLAAIGKTDRPVPMSFARALLDPAFAFPDRLSELKNIRAQPISVLHSLAAIEDFRLVCIDQELFYDEHGRPHLGGLGNEYKVQAVVSQGWRRRNFPIFLGYPAQNVNLEFRKLAKALFDHDGTRLVRLDATPAGELPASVLPIVELSEIIPDITTLADAVRANPKDLLDAATRAKHWAEKYPSISGVAKRIVEAVLLEFVPWPHPFRRRTEAEQRLRPQESYDAVVALFDRLLDAPGPIRPADLTAYFYSLITKRRAEFSAWPEELAGVWGFKIKTGDHNWIEGRIWHEPNGTDNPSDPVECDESASLIEQGRHRSRYRHRVSLKTGTLRCYIQRDDT